MSSIPLQKIVNNVASGIYKAKPAKVFELNDIAVAHKLMEDNKAKGKIVVYI